ncbi:hypothetical protein, partial [Pandoraea sputorum]|uniref:hypothetical protein n=1 Tax=Pandoraea sputorum TaxID=93222 RepID=UPI0035574534
QLRQRLNPVSKITHRPPLRMSIFMTCHYRHVIKLDIFAFIIRNKAFIFNKLKIGTGVALLLSRTVVRQPAQKNNKEFYR